MAYVPVCSADLHSHLSIANSRLFPSTFSGPTTELRKLDQFLKSKLSAKIVLWGHGRPYRQEVSAERCHRCDAWNHKIKNQYVLKVAHLLKAKLHRTNLSKTRKWKHKLKKYATTIHEPSRMYRIHFYNLTLEIFQTTVCVYFSSQLNWRNLAFNIWNKTNSVTFCIRFHFICDTKFKHVLMSRKIELAQIVIYRLIIWRKQNINFEGPKIDDRCEFVHVTIFTRKIL